jgi:hypothetical protein
MTSLSRRLQRLEAGCPQSDEVVADRYKLIRHSALDQLTVGELRGLIEADNVLQAGREHTSQEVGALSALNTAVNLECQKAGISRAAFDRYHSADI